MTMKVARWGSCELLLRIILMKCGGSGGSVSSVCKFLILLNRLTFGFITNFQTFLKGKTTLILIFCIISRNHHFMAAFSISTAVANHFSASADLRQFLLKCHCITINCSISYWEPDDWLDSQTDKEPLQTLFLKTASFQVL